MIIPVVSVPPYAGSAGVTCTVICAVGSTISSMEPLDSCPARSSQPFVHAGVSEGGGFLLDWHTSRNWSALCFERLVVSRYKSAFENDSTNLRGSPDDRPAIYAGVCVVGIVVPCT